MKTWFAVSAFLSALLLGALLVSMQSCHRQYEIDARGRLLLVTPVPQPSGPVELKREERTWEGERGQFLKVRDFVRPGDRLVYTSTSAGFDGLPLGMTEWEVFRNDQSVLVARDGAVKFWGAVAAVALVPLLCWAGGALWISLAPRRAREGPA
jgi:hypothetical protein